MLFVEMGPVGSWEKMEGNVGPQSLGTFDKRSNIEIADFRRSVLTCRRSKVEVEQEFRHLSLLASIIESAQLLQKTRKSRAGRHSSGIAGRA